MERVRLNKIIEAIAKFLVCFVGSGIIAFGGFVVYTLICIVGVAFRIGVLEALPNPLPLYVLETLGFLLFWAVLIGAPFLLVGI